MGNDVIPELSNGFIKKLNDNGEQLTEFCTHHEHLTIHFLNHKPQHKNTGKIPEGKLAQLTTQLPVKKYIRPKS